MIRPVVCGDCNQVSGGLTQVTSLARCRLLRDPPATLIRNRTPLGPYRRPMPRVIGGPKEVGGFLCARYPCDRLWHDPAEARMQREGYALATLGPYSRAMPRALW